MEHGGVGTPHGDVGSSTPARYVADPDGTPQIAVPVATMPTETT